MDIVERLQGYIAYNTKQSREEDDVMRDAAAEIERLRAVHSAWRKRATEAEALKNLDWVPLAKALFQIEHDPRIADQAWFDFRGKAERIIAAMQNQ